MIFIFFLSACSAFNHLPDKKNSFDNLAGWWERYYPEGYESSGEWNLSHIEFMNGGECSYTMGKYEGEQYVSGTYNNMLWKPDSSAPSDVFVLSPHDTVPYFYLSFIGISESTLVFRLSLSEDTVYMKRLPRLH